MGGGRGGVAHEKHEMARKSDFWGTEYTDHTEETTRGGVADFGRRGEGLPSKERKRIVFVDERVGLRGKNRQGVQWGFSVSIYMNSPDPLPSLLASWSHEPVPDSHFNEAVWARIHAGEQARPRAPISWFPSTLPMAASVALLLSIAGGTGWAHALNTAQSADRMASAYVRSIDPIQMATHPVHSHDAP